jgi:hypothetical protein
MGEVEAQIRVVVCRDKLCAPQELVVVGHLEVGP